MINAEVMPHSENLVYYRFYDPNEEFGNKPYIPVDSIKEVKQRLATRNKAYILETLIRWLNQRMHANTSQYRNINKFLAWIADVRNSRPNEVFDFIELRRPIIESFAPPTDSKFYNDYKIKIIPILDFCVTPDKDINGTSSL